MNIQWDRKYFYKEITDDNNRRGDHLKFYIQASKPRFEEKMDLEDRTLSEAIETVFPLETEYAFMFWNGIGIPLSYKYDINYMIYDILALLEKLQSQKTGKLIIKWLPDTFRSDWMIQWSDGEIHVDAQWECVSRLPQEEVLEGTVIARLAHRGRFIGSI